MTADIGVLGAGVIGLSIAWRLAAEGHAVVVVDSGAGPQSSRAAAGMLAPSFETGRNSAVHAALAVFSRNSLAQWRDFGPSLEAAAGRSIDLQLTGVLGVAADRDGAAELDAQAAAMHAVGARAERLDGAATRRFAPGLWPGAMTGLYAADEGQVDPFSRYHSASSSSYRMSMSSS